MAILSKEDIYKAIEENRIKLYGQPKWTFGKNTCNTYEVFADLLISEDEEPVLPADFLPVIQADPELTEAFGNWFLDHAFADAARLMEMLSVHLTVSINIMGFQANRPEFIYRLRDILHKHGLNRTHLQVELSEVQPIDDIGAANLKTLHEEYDIPLVLGNFGTGYSTIDLLRKIPFSIIEISKDFIRDIENFERDFNIIIGILEMAKILGVQVCAKGIETPEQMEMLEDSGFTMGQGFLIAKPMPFDELAKFIDQYAQR